MEYFLERISKTLLDEFGNNLNRHCLVFPSRRAGLYFIKYLAGRIKKPVWVPSIMTINELFSSCSDLQKAENELLLFELYKVYRRVSKTGENFDEFYFWGDVLINDFDDVDKYLADASLLFRNVKDIRNIEQQFGGLTEEQIEIVRRFWTNFNPDKPTREKEGFLKIWAILFDLYTEFRRHLREKNLAYEGMIFRDLAESTDSGRQIEMKWDMIHFIGFNALNNCEKRVMAWFKSEGNARFYWDYDISFISSGRLNSAGFFMSENLKSFGDDMPADWSHDTMLSSHGKRAGRKVISTSSDVAQVKLISPLIEGISDLSPQNAHHTAVVLADEKLLMPSLTSLPQNIGDVNITMGYPLNQTPVFTLVRNLLLLQRNARKGLNTVYFNYRDVMCILKDGLIGSLMNDADNKLVTEIVQSNLVMVQSDFFAQSEPLASIFRVMSTPASLSEYLRNILTQTALIAGKHSHGSSEPDVSVSVVNEFIYRVLLSINRLDALTGDPDISFTTETYMKILERILRNQSVPFSGEPLSGIQIMGILETRALDFKNLIMLSVNEGIIPAIPAGSSFIPYNLRISFGLPDINHQESVYAYHFYRLLQRAENVTFIYNSNSEGLRSGEMSRFLFQMKYDPVLKPDFVSLGFLIATQNTLKDKIERREEHSRWLTSFYGDRNSFRLLSPTAINIWLNCRMRFYYRYVNRLKEAEKVTPDIDPAMLGSMLHGIMKNLYRGFAGSELSAEMIDAMITDGNLLDHLIDKALSDVFNFGKDNLLSGKELIIKDVLKAYTHKILRTDKSATPFVLLEIEKSFSFGHTLVDIHPRTEIVIGGDIDRVDRMGGVIRIVDYKTGNVAEKIDSIGSLFEDDREKDLDAWLQILLYCEAYMIKHPGAVVRPSIYKVKESAGKDFSDRLRIKADKNDEIVEDYGAVREKFILSLSDTITKIFSSDEPFIMTQDQRKCNYCVYRDLCMR